jgi:hypothetical protein
MNLDFTYETGPKTSKFSRVVEDARQKRAQDAKLRLARIQNGKEPGYTKGGRCKGK